MRTIALILVGLLIAAAIAWDAAEQHYRACVAAAEARTPVNVVPASSDTLGGPSVTGEAARARAVKGCSRLPW